MDFKKFVEDGYQVNDLMNVQQIETIQKRLTEETRKLTGEPSLTLETFHKFVVDDNEKIRIQNELVQIIRKEALHKPLFENNIDLFRELIGGDINIQTDPYLRIARPRCPQDNIGYHRDTFYGNSAYEVSCLFALVDLNEEGALEVEPRSHCRGPIPVTQINNDEVAKGSIRNSLGIPYAPKLINKDVELKMVPAVMKAGQVLLLSLGNLHGQEVNKSDITRWSIDARIVNRFCIESGNTKSNYYTPIMTTPATEAALAYYEAMNGVVE